MTFHNFQKIALGLGIIIVLNLFINFGVFTFYKPPIFENFCGDKNQQYYGDKTSCENTGGKWIVTGPTPVYDSRYAPLPTKPTLSQENLGGYCDTTATCRPQFESATDFYNRNVFLVLVVAGAISIVIGLFAVSVEAVSSGFLFGGIVSLMVGTIRYWSSMDDYMRFVVLGVTLAILIWTGYKKLKDR